MRAFQLQMIAPSTWRVNAREARAQGRDVEPSRGAIVDADGVPLAVDRSILRLAFVPEEWTTRARWRCRSCGTVHFRRSSAWLKPLASGLPRPPASPGACS